MRTDSHELTCKTAQKVLETAIRSFPLRPEMAMRNLVRMPDKIHSTEPGCAFADIAAELMARYSDEPIRKGLTLFASGILSYRTGHNREAWRALNDAIETADAMSAGLPGWALASAAECSMALASYRHLQVEKAVEYARAAANRARANGAPWLEASARFALGNALRNIPGERDRSRAALEEAHRLYGEVSPPDPLALAFVLRNEARLALDAGNPTQALALLREARAGFGRSREYRALAHSKIDQGWAHFHQRALEVARTCGEAGLEQSAAIGDESGVNRARRLLARVAVEQNRPEEALRLLDEAVKGARRLRDEDEESEALVDLAWAHFGAGRLKQAEKDLQTAQPLLRANWASREGLHWQTLDVALRIRRRKLKEVHDLVRRLRSALTRFATPRLTAECMALVGFELAKQGKLRDAAPILKETLGAASQIDAMAWTDRFMGTVSSVDVRQWITSLVTEMQEHESLAEQYHTMRICAIAGLHDVKNLATSAYSELEVLAIEEEQCSEALVSAKDTAFQAGRLAADVELQIIEGNTQIRVHSSAMGILGFLRVQAEVIERSSRLGHCTIDAPDDLPMAMADERYIARVFGNFKSNAEKYAHGCDITLSARLPRGLKGDMVIGFADNGQGLDPQDAEIIFNAFKNPNEYRQKRADHGTGFGLHYCKLVAEAHGGKIWVDPGPGRGVAFYFTLPIARESGPG